jgi:hypothetical protein
MYHNIYQLIYLLIQILAYKNPFPVWETFKEMIEYIIVLRSTYPIGKEQIKPLVDSLQTDYWNQQ